MGDLVHALGIQWSALIAQMVNFAILIIVLTKFVYKPVLRIIDERRAIVAASLKKAEEIDRRQEIIDAERTAILRKADLEAGALLERAKGEAEAMHAEIEKTAKQEALQTLKKGMEKLEKERSIMFREVQGKLAHAIVLSAEKILRREFSKEDQQNFEEELKKNLPSMLS